MLLIASCLGFLFLSEFPAHDGDEVNILDRMQTEDSVGVALG